LGEFLTKEADVTVGYMREVITSPQNKYVSLARGLANKKNREKEKLFRFDGIKLMCEAIKRGVVIDFILASESEWSAVLEKAEKLYSISENDINCNVIFVSDSVFERLSDEMAPEGVICVAKYAENIKEITDTAELSSIGNDEKVLLLESVRDPSNIGAILRVAAAFGVDMLVVSRDCADVYNPKTLRASMGAMFGLQVCKVDSIPDAVAALRKGGRRVFAAALDRDAVKLGELKTKQGDCVIIGNEGHGLTAEAIAACDGTVFIPMSDGVESLNAATAAAVLVWEFFGKGGVS
jgi:TrmH family RNA methyltransferase